MPKKFDISNFFYNSGFMKILMMGIIAFFSEGIFAKKLLVYSSRKEHLIKEVFEMYRKETGVIVEYSTGKAGVLIEKLKEEGKHTKADILLTVDGGNLWYAAKEGLFSTIPEKILQGIPSHLKDPSNHWVGVSVRARTLVYNTNLLLESSLSTYEDLALPKWKGKLWSSHREKGLQSISRCHVDRTTWQAKGERDSGWLGSECCGYLS